MKEKNKKKTKPKVKQVKVPIYVSMYALSLGFPLEVSAVHLN